MHVWKLILSSGEPYVLAQCLGTAGLLTRGWGGGVFSLDSQNKHQQPPLCAGTFRLATTLRRRSTNLKCLWMCMCVQVCVCEREGILSRMQNAIVLYAHSLLHSPLTSFSMDATWKLYSGFEQNQDSGCWQLRIMEKQERKTNEHRGRQIKSLSITTLWGFQLIFTRPL